MSLLTVGSMKRSSLIGTVNQTCLAFFMLFSYFDKIRISNINQDVLSGCEFLVNSRILLAFDPHVLCLLSDLCQSPYHSPPIMLLSPYHSPPPLMLLNNSQFLASPLREGQAVPL